MIVTHRARVPWHWVVLMTLPWGTVSLLGSVNGQAITYTLKKYLADPSWIALLASVNLLTNVLVAAPCNYMSDRLWTRWGRRRPFLISSAVSTAFLLLFIPWLPNIWLLAVVNLLLQVAIDVGSCTEALYFEVIPQPQRGRAVAIRHVINGLTGIFFGAVLFAQFDRRYTLDLRWLGLTAPLTWTGEHMLYCAAALVVLATAVLYLVLVRETPPAAPMPRGPAFNPVRFVAEVFGDKRWYPVYLYYAIPAVIVAGAAQFSPLVMTDVFGYTKADIVRIGVSQMLLQLFILTPLMGWLADRIPRVRMFQIGIIGAVVWVALYWFYLKVLAPQGLPRLCVTLPWLGACSFTPVNGVPTLPFLFCWGMAGSVFSIAVALTNGALLFDLVPSNKMGTLASGFGLINSALGALLMNLCGWFVKYYSRWWYAPNAQDATRYDYTAIYPFQIVFGVIGIGMYLYFLRQYKRGKVIEYGKRELQEELRRAADHAARGGGRG
jgi:MFS family permease